MTPTPEVAPRCPFCNELNDVLVGENNALHYVPVDSRTPPQHFHATRNGRTTVLCDDCVAAIKRSTQQFALECFARSRWPAQETFSERWPLPISEQAIQRTRMGREVLSRYGLPFTAAWPLDYIGYVREAPVDHKTGTAAVTLVGPVVRDERDGDGAYAWRFTEPLTCLPPYLGELPNSRREDAAWRVAKTVIADYRDRLLGCKIPRPGRPKGHGPWTDPDKFKAEVVKAILGLWDAGKDDRLQERVAPLVECNSARQVYRLCDQDGWPEWPEMVTEAKKIRADREADKKPRR